jgi:hypothetical protein
MAAKFDFSPTASASVRPQFSLGGQVSRYSSNPQIHENSENSNYIENNNSGKNDEIMSSQQTTPLKYPSKTHKSLNPELLMREFTQDDQGRLESLGETDSPSACFQSKFARDVVQNTRKNSSAFNETGSSNQPSLEKISINSNSNNNRSVAAASNNGPPSSSRRSSYLTNPKYRSQFATRHHLVRKYSTKTFANIITVIGLEYSHKYWHVRLAKKTSFIIAKLSINSINSYNLSINFDIFR